MIFKIKKVEDESLQADYDRAMKKLNEFYGLNWTFGRPQVILVPDRQTINDVWDKKSENWQIGWVNGGITFILENEAMKENSCHRKKSPEEYYSLIKHELSHIFFRHLSKANNGPKWFWEGVATYTSGQLAFQKPVTKFEKFLDSTDKMQLGLYEESGFAIELLVKKYGKEKLLDLIKNLASCPKNEDFIKKFEEIYHLPLNYDEFNNFLPKI
ncbi:MAG: hypothetical protein NT041_00005 [Candidatus Vogelbacteria bacterium]|nr:hypothetical protein [Candidatus Vogelbacteria bacterium]